MARRRPLPYAFNPQDRQGFCEAGHRWYDAVVGRWLSEDPIGFAAGDGNLYRYVGNGPVGAVDPTGQFTTHGPAPADKVAKLEELEKIVVEELEFLAGVTGRIAANLDGIKEKMGIRDPSDQKHIQVSRFAERIQRYAKKMAEEIKGSSYQLRFPEEDTWGEAYAQVIRYRFAFGRTEHMCFYPIFFSDNTSEGKRKGVFLHEISHWVWNTDDYEGWLDDWLDSEKRTGPTDKILALQDHVTFAHFWEYVGEGMTLREARPGRDNPAENLFWPLVTEWRKAQAKKTQ